MALSGPQRAQIVEALMEAFPRYADLRYMLSKQLDINIETIVPAGATIRDGAFEVVVQMDARDRINELLRGALNENRTNRSLIACGVAFGEIGRASCRERV